MRLTRRDLVQQVTLAGVSLVLPSATASAKAVTTRVEIRRFAFSPEEVTIEVGETVEWHNGDLAPHTATSDDGNWDTGTLAKGDHTQIRFDQPGTYTYFCAFHPHMVGKVIVTN